MLIIRGGRILDPKNGLDFTGDITIEGGRIREIIRRLTTCFQAHKASGQVDASGLLVIPGLVDIHAHFRDPGQTYKEDLHSGAEAAARGGYTTVVCMANASPPFDSPERLDAFLSRAKSEPVNICAVGALTRGLAGRELAPLAELQAAGAAAFSDDGCPVTDSGLLRRGMEQCQALGAVLSLHEEDPSLCGLRGLDDGEAARAWGVHGSPAVSEYSLIARDAMLALDTGARVHFQHLSAARSADIVGWAKALGAPVSAELCPHHFSLTSAAAAEKGPLAKVNPPLRSEADRLALIAALAAGTIDCIATDHAPHSAAEKALPFAEAPSGMIGLETALALGITYLVRPGFLSLADLVYRMTAVPAGLLGLDAGEIRVGGPADLAIIAPDERWVMEKFHSKSANSPFVGTELAGRVKAVVARGEVVFGNLIG
jgi:dihydroorotase